MKSELQEQLFKRFPSLFREKDLSMMETCMCWGCDVGDGWYDLLYETCEKIEKLNQDICFGQVKEKYGGLTIHVNDYSDEVTDILNKAEDESYKTCERCGTKENVTSEGLYILTLCHNCREKRKQGRTLL